MDSSRRRIAVVFAVLALIATNVVSIANAYRLRAERDYALAFAGACLKGMAFEAEPNVFLRCRIEKVERF